MKFNIRRIFFLAIIFFATDVKSQNWWEQGLVAHYAFDSLSTFDSSISGIHLNSSPNIQSSQNRFNELEKAINLPQPTDNVSGISTHLPTSNLQRSISIWIKVNQFPDFTLPFACAFFYGEQLEKKGQGLVIDDVGGLAYAGYKSTAFSDADLLSNNRINEGEWVHVGLSYDGDTAKIYIDGILDNMGLKSWNTSSNELIHFGRMGFSANPQGGGTTILPYDGAIDDFRAYDRELSSEEMLKLATDDFTTLINQIDPKSHERSSVSIFPNPVKNQLTIKGLDSNAKLEIISLSDNLKIQIEERNLIDLTFLKPGVYILKIVTNSGIQHKKFIKEN